MQFVGAIVGDYAKTAINTGIFTGKTIGACSMLYGFVTTNVPSFVNYARLFGQVTEAPVEVMVATQRACSRAAASSQRPCDIQLLHDMYELTRHERQLARRAAVAVRSQSSLERLGGRSAANVAGCRRPERFQLACGSPATYHTRSGITDCACEFAEAYGPGKFGLSFELFPPKTPAGEAELFRHLDDLLAFRAQLCHLHLRGAAARRATRRSTSSSGSAADSAAGGLAFDVRRLDGRRIARLSDRSGRSAGVDEHRRVARRSAARAKPNFRPVAGGLRYANELVDLIRREFPHFGIAVAGYPETHQEARQPRGRSGQSAAQGRRRRRHRDHAIVLRQRDFFRFPRSLRGSWEFACRSCRAFCR